MLHHLYIYHNQLIHSAYIRTQTPLGRVLNRFSRDINAIDTQLAAMLLWSIVALGTSAGALIGLVLTTNGVFAAVLVPMVIMYNSIYQRARRCGIQLQRFQSTTRSPIYSSFSEMLVGLSTVRAYGHQDRFMAQNRDALRANVVPYFLARSGLPAW
jgi:ABC-type multidrug transport system fused ATPase/permease subunit